MTGPPLSDSRQPMYKQSRLSWKGRQNLYGYGLALPALILVIGLVAYPFFYAIYISFTNRVVGNPGHWVGLDNYRYLAKTASFTRSIQNTITIVIVTDILKLIIGLGLALLVNQRIRARGFFRATLMLPWAIPGFVAFLTWRVMYQPIGGGINLLLAETGLHPDVIDWLGQKSTAMPAVIVATTWRGFPFWFISLLAALQGVRPDLYEAARVDGANAIQRFWSVTLPAIKPVILVTVLLSSIWTANAFENVYLLTNGGPSDATMVFPILAFQGMQTQLLGQSAAVSVAMLPVLAILVFVVTTLMQTDDE